MKRKPYIVLLLLMLCCLAFGGCGQEVTESAETEVLNSEAEQVADAKTEAEAEQDKEDVSQKSAESEESVQEKYTGLAEENLALREQCDALYTEYVYYENLRMAKSVKGFEVKEKGLFPGEADAVTEETEFTEVEEIDVHGIPAESEAFMQIPEVSDEEAESRIPRLEEENKALQNEIKNYKYLIELYRGMITP